MIGSRDLDKGETAARQIRHGATALQLDVSDPVSVAAAFALIDQEYGHLDILVNNAGIDYDTDQQATAADLGRDLARYRSDRWVLPGRQRNTLVNGLPP